MDDPDVTSLTLSDQSMVKYRYPYQILCYCCHLIGANNVFRKHFYLATTRAAPLDPHNSEDVWWTVTVFLIVFQSCESLFITANSLPSRLPCSFPDLCTPETFVLTFVETDVQRGLKMGKEAHKTAVQTWMLVQISVT